MRNQLDQLFARHDIEPNEGATPETIEAVAQAYGATLPDLLVELWRRADGLALPELNGHLIGPTELLPQIADEGWRDYFVPRGLLPILDDHESNYLVIAVRPPLAFRVIALPHDGDRRILYRDPESWLAEFLAVFDEDKFVDEFLHEARGQYDARSKRSAADQEAARELLRNPVHDQDENLAVQLLDDSNLAEWEKLLETEHFLRRDAVKRLRESDSPELHQLLDRDRKAFEQFAMEVAQAAKAAGLDVGKRSDDCLQVNGRWMNLDGFFYRRHAPNALPRIIAWFEDLIARRHPSHRAGNIMEVP